MKSLKQAINNLRSSLHDANIALKRLEQIYQSITGEKESNEPHLAKSETKFKYPKRKLSEDEKKLIRDTWNTEYRPKYKTLEERKLLTVKLGQAFKIPCAQASAIIFNTPGRLKKNPETRSFEPVVSTKTKVLD